MLVFCIVFLVVFVIIGIVIARWFKQCNNSIINSVVNKVQEQKNIGISEWFLLSISSITFIIGIYIIPFIVFNMIFIIGTLIGYIQLGVIHREISSLWYLELFFIWFIIFYFWYGYLLFTYPISSLFILFYQLIMICRENEYMHILNYLELFGNFLNTYFYHFYSNISRVWVNTEKVIDIIFNNMFWIHSYLIYYYSILSYYYSDIIYIFSFYFYRSFIYRDRAFFYSLLATTFRILNRLVWIYLITLLVYTLHY